EEGPFPRIGQAIGVRVRAGGNVVGLHNGKSVAQGDPAAIGGVNGAAEVAGGQIHPGRAVIFKIDPPDIRAPGKAAQIAEAVVVHAVIGCGIVLVLDAVGGRVAAEVNPADVRRVDVARADLFADDRAAVRV